MNSA
jgi:hypothetical protein